MKKLTAIILTLSMSLTMADTYEEAVNEGPSINQIVVVEDALDEAEQYLKDLEVVRSMEDMYINRYGK